MAVQNTAYRCLMRLLADPAAPAPSTERTDQHFIQEILADRDGMLDMLKRQQAALAEYATECASLRATVDEMRSDVARLASALLTARADVSRVEKAIAESQRVEDDLLHELVRVRWNEFLLRDALCLDTGNACK